MATTFGPAEILGNNGYEFSSPGIAPPAAGCALVAGSGSGNQYQLGWTLRPVLMEPAVGPLNSNQYLAADKTWKSIPPIDSGSVVGALGYTPANDSQVVKLTGDQNISGLKTFGNTLNVFTSLVNTDAKLRLEATNSLGRAWDLVSSGGFELPSGYLGIKNNINSTYPMVFGRLGEVGIGLSGLSPTVVTGVALEVRGANRIAGATNVGFGLLHVASNNAAAADIGGMLTLGGFRDVGMTGPRAFVAISGRKENSTDLNQAGYFSLAVNNNGSMVERLRVSSDGMSTFSGNVYTGNAFDIGWSDAQFGRIGAGSIGVYGADGVTLAGLTASNLTASGSTPALTITQSGIDPNYSMIAATAGGNNVFSAVAAGNGGARNIILLGRNIQWLVPQNATPSMLTVPTGLTISTGGTPFNIDNRLTMNFNVPVTAVPNTASVAAFVARGVASQTGNLFEAQTVGGTAVASISAAGNLSTGPQITVNQVGVNGTALLVNNDFGGFRIVSGGGSNINLQSASGGAATLQVQVVNINDYVIAQRYLLQGGGRLTPITNGVRIMNGAQSADGALQAGAITIANGSASIVLTPDSSNNSIVTSGSNGTLWQDNSGRFYLYGAGQPFNSGLGITHGTNVCDMRLGPSAHIRGLSTSLRIASATTSFWTDANFTTLGPIEAGTITASGNVSVGNNAFVAGNWNIERSSTNSASIGIRNSVSGVEAIHTTQAGETRLRGNLTLNALSGNEAGIIFQQGGAGRWQLYDSAGLLRLYNYVTANEAFNINSANNATTFNGAITASGNIQQGLNSITPSYRSRMLAAGQRASEVGDGAGAWSTVYREDYNGGTMRFGWGAALTPLQSIAAAATDAASTQNLANSIRTILLNLGLVI